jgi:hypothetical protein
MDPLTTGNKNQSWVLTYNHSSLQKSKNWSKNLPWTGGVQIQMTNVGRFFDFLLFNFKEPYGVTKSKNRPTLVISQATETGNLTPVWVTGGEM